MTDPWAVVAAIGACAALPVGVSAAFYSRRAAKGPQPQPYIETKGELTPEHRLRARVSNAGGAATDFIATLAHEGDVFEYRAPLPAGMPVVDVEISWVGTSAVAGPEDIALSMFVRDADRRWSDVLTGAKLRRGDGAVTEARRAAMDRFEVRTSGGDLVSARFHRYRRRLGRWHQVD